MQTAKILRKSHILASKQAVKCKLIPQDKKLPLTGPIRNSSSSHLPKKATLAISSRICSRGSMPTLRPAVPAASRSGDLMRKTLTWKSPSQPNSCMKTSKTVLRLQIPKWSKTLTRTASSDQLCSRLSAPSFSICSRSRRRALWGSIARIRSLRAHWLSRNPRKAHQGSTYWAQRCSRQICLRTRTWLRASKWTFAHTQTPPLSSWWRSQASQAKIRQHIRETSWAIPSRTW